MFQTNFGNGSRSHWVDKKQFSNQKFHCISFIYDFRMMMMIIRAKIQWHTKSSGIDSTVDGCNIYVWLLITQKQGKQNSSQNCEIISLISDSIGLVWFYAAHVYSIRLNSTWQSDLSCHTTVNGTFKLIVSLCCILKRASIPQISRFKHRNSVCCHIFPILLRSFVVAVHMQITCDNEIIHSHWILMEMP